MNDTTTTRHIHIWQQNIAKSGIAQHNLLAKANPTNWEIIALQEPYLNHLGLTHAHNHWNIYYPSSKNLTNQKHTCSIILTNTNITSSQIQQINIQSSDITAIKITTTTQSLIIINVYNDNGNNDSINTLSDTWMEHENTWLGNQDTKIIILGDFNQHHSIWESRTNSHLTSLDRLLNPLLDLIINMHLEMALLCNIPTLEACNTGNWTHPDNVWCCMDLPSPFITCNVDASLHPVYTDHLPIVSTIDLAYMPKMHMVQFNYKTIDWEKYKKQLEENLKSHDTILTNPINTPENFELATNAIFEAINKTTSEIATTMKTTLHMKQWWTSELMNLCISRNRASTEHHRWRGLLEHPSHREYKSINTTFTNTIEREQKLNIGRNGSNMHVAMTYGPYTNT
jgi:hypothetical protein